MTSTVESNLTEHENVEVSSPDMEESKEETKLEPSESSSKNIQESKEESELEPSESFSEDTQESKEESELESSESFSEDTQKSEEESELESVVSFIDTGLDGTGTESLILQEVIMQQTETISFGFLSVCILLGLILGTFYIYTFAGFIRGI